MVFSMMFSMVFSMMFSMVFSLVFSMVFSMMFSMVLSMVLSVVLAMMTSTSPEVRCCECKSQYGGCQDYEGLHAQVSPFTSEPKLTNPKGEVHPTLYLGLSSDHVTGLVAENRIFLNLN